jgi:acyl-CoA thioester hydrolase
MPMNIDSDKYIVSINFEIKTYDIDIAGHVNNIVYVKWLEDLRNKLFLQLLPVGDLLEEKLYLVITSTSINYKKQLKFGDEPVGTMNIINATHGMMVLNFRFTINENICVYGEQKCVILNLKTGLMDKEKLKSIFNE